MNIFSNRFEVEFDELRDAYTIRSPDHPESELPIVEIRRETLAKMSLKQAAEFIGERLILLTPAMREQFKDYLWSDDGKEPHKLR